MKYAVSLFIIASLTACGGSSSSDVEKDRDTSSVAERRVSEEDAALLDEKVEGTRDGFTAAAAVVRMELPETPSAPGREIDGSDGDWDRKLFRTFASKKFVESGKRFWRGRSDMSFRVAVDDDPGYLYFYVDVVDDKVIADEEGVTDAVVLTVRDPNLDSLAKSVPSEAKIQDLVKAETSIVFYPDGRFERFERDDPLPDNFGFVVVNKTKRGYALEIALQVEAFEQVSQFPLKDIAFRVTALDGDDTDRPGVQTVMSMLPDRGTDDPTMALYDVNGLLPHYEIAKAPPRKNAIGAWNTGEKKWSFEPFETVSKHWMTIGDAPAFMEALKKTEGLNDICKTSRRDVELIDAYESRGGGFRAGLVACGDRAPRGCRAGSQTDVFWVHLKPDASGEWYIQRAVNVFAKTLPQCLHEPIDGQPFLSRLSLFPMDMVNAKMWAVGWTRKTDSSALRERVNGVTFMDGSRRNPVVGTAITDETRSEPDQRIRVNARVYLTYVDDDGYLDVCQIEDVNEQVCSGMDRGCRTWERGKTVLTTIQMYNPRMSMFERYDLSKHRGCKNDFNFAEREGFLLLQTKGRVGFVPSPKSQAESGESLDLF